MAIYKPTDCVPFNGTFDMGEDLPIYFECKLDTSNNKVDGYSMEIFDENGKRVFPINEITDGSNITLIKDIGASLNLTNFNNGYNGSYLKFPFVVENGKKVANNYNQISPDDNILQNGGQYTWRITLYQAIIDQAGSKSFPPPNEKYYDMAVANGYVLGSTNERIQTALVDEDDAVVSDLVLVDKFVQPIKINNLSYTIENPIAWTGDNDIEFSTSRVLINGYDSSYGHIYPSTAKDNSFVSEQITQNLSNGFQIFKNGNNPDILGATDQASFIFDDPISDGQSIGGATWTWVNQLADETTSYWQEEYYVSAKPSGVYYPIGQDHPLYGNERVIFNNTRTNAVTTPAGKYLGSPYNGIFYPVFGTEPSGSGYTVTVRWFRTTDAKTWGAIANKVVYVQSENYNMEISSNTIGGGINKTPFMFVREKPQKLFNSSTLTTESILVSLSSRRYYLITVNKDISTIVSLKIVTSTGETIVNPSDYYYEQNANYIVYTPANIQSGALNFSIEYYPYLLQDYAGVIFYNKKIGSNSFIKNMDGVLYIRKSINIRTNMIFKEIVASSNARWFNIWDYNSKYGYVTYGKINNGDEDFKIDKDRYQIKSFFKSSDYNPFYFYKDPDIATKIVINNNIFNLSQTGSNFIDSRNFRVFVEYEQENYIWWKSYRWTLYDQEKNIVLSQTKEVYSGVIEANFYGLEENQTYILTLTIQTNSNKILEIDYKLVSNFNPKNDQNFSNIIEAFLDCNTLAVEASASSVGVVAPKADQYLSTSASASQTGNTVFYYDSADFYRVRQKNGSYETIAKLEGLTSNAQKMSLLKNNELIYEKTFKDYKISDANTASLIQTSENEICFEGSFNFSEHYEGRVIRFDNPDTNNYIEIAIPAFLNKTFGGGKVAADADKIIVRYNGNLAYINISVDGIIADVWQNSNKWINISNTIPILPEASGTIKTDGNLANYGPIISMAIKDDEGNYINTSEYYNISGLYNAYGIDNVARSQNDTSFVDQFSTYVSSDEGMKLLKDVNGYEYKINGTNRIIWADFVLNNTQLNVVTHANEENGVEDIGTTLKSVMTNEINYWNDNWEKLGDAIYQTKSQNFKWVDGFMVTNGNSIVGTMGGISLNGIYQKIDIINSMTEVTVGTNVYVSQSLVCGSAKRFVPSYSASGLIKQQSADPNIYPTTYPGRNDIKNHTFVFRLFFKNKTFAFEKTKSMCYILPI